MQVKRLPAVPRVIDGRRGPRTLGELLARSDVVEQCELRSTFGLMAIHGGGLELMTDVIAGAAATLAGASYYAVLHADDVDHHLSSLRYRPQESSALAVFIDHVDVAVSIHGYGRDGSWTSILVGGCNRRLATVVADEARPRLAGYDLVTDLDRIPWELRGLNGRNPVNLPRSGGVQLELPPRVRGLSPSSPPPGDDGYSPPTRALIEALAAVAECWLACDRCVVIELADAEQIAGAFGVGPVVGFSGPDARGELGQVWRLTVAAGEWAVKESFIEGGVDDHTMTTEFHEAAVSAGVPAPAVRRSIDGAASVLVRGSVVRLVSWIDLDPPDTTMDATMVGATLAAIHLVPFGGSLPTHPWYSEPVGAARWDGLIAELGAHRSPLAERFAHWRDEFVALERWLAPGRASQVCHRDLWSDNLRRTFTGGPCVIDWDNAGEADPNQELAMVLYEFSGGDAARAQQLVAAYTDGGGSGRVRGRADFSMTIAVLGHLAERIGVLWLATGSTAAERRRQEGRFDEFDERPLTRYVIDALLDAVA